jgi:hypothetical protein
MKQQTQKVEAKTETEVSTAIFQTSQDVKTAILIVSVLANVTLFVVWLMLQVTTQYDAAIAGWLFS